jgi:Ca2+-binding EF-hand superfamily protein
MQEFRYFMVHMGMQFSEQEVDEMIHEVDVDGDGEINYEEFVKVQIEGIGIGRRGREAHGDSAPGIPPY